MDAIGHVMIAPEIYTFQAVSVFTISLLGDQMIGDLCLIGFDLLTIEVVLFFRTVLRLS